ncbi:MAG: (Fe-S)-binding protein [Candidatus Zhuqueibacterota bacterium]
MTERELEILGEQAYQEAIRCIRCGYCQPTCPTYVVTGIEHSVARGRNYLARKIYEKEIPLTKDFKDPIFECLLCGACNTNCAPVVKTQQIMAAARAMYIHTFGQPPLQRFVFNELLPNPRRMTRLMKLASLGKRSGISGLAQALRVFKWIGKNIANAEGLLKTLPGKFLRERLTEIQFPARDSNLKIGYFVGCGINYAFPDVGLATLHYLTRNKYSVEVLENLCCGLPASGYGDVAAAKRMAQRNIEIVEKSGCDIVVSECGSCSSFLSEYVHLLAGEPAWERRAQEFSRRVMDINVFLTQFPRARELKATQAIVTYHDPCHLGHYMKIKEQPRQLLQQIEGIEFREMAEADWCCGGAGTYNIAHYDLSMKILKRKIENVRRTEASVLTSSCPGCLIQLSYGIRKYNHNAQVKHIIQILNESLE